MQPYDPDKEPLIMIHGLLGSPLVWAELSNTLWADNEIRSRYQIWHFLYNTSAPALYSGRLLRSQLRELRELLDPDGDDPAMQSTTIIAHSMGGIITRSLLTHPGDAFWDAAFNQSFDSLKLSDADRESLREAFFWKSTPHVKRAIYIAASHRGSDFADNLIGRLGRIAARPPKSGFQDFYERISTANPGAFTKAYEELGRGKLDSVNALSPRQPTLSILASLPNQHPVREFSIIGTGGKSGPVEKSSDGIVAYWSSHIDRAESEKIVPATHHDLNHEETVAEVRRILKLP
jgi:pimeloyl-ACP methyl ester carboxylesterase